MSCTDDMYQRIFLIGKTRQGFEESKFPTKNEVLCVFFHHHRVDPKPSIAKTAQIVTKLLTEHYENQGNSSVCSRSTVRSIKRLYSSWQKMQKNEKLPKQRRTQFIKNKEVQYKQSLASLFKVSDDSLNCKDNVDDEIISCISSQFSQLSTDHQGEDSDEYVPPTKRQRRQKVCGENLASSLDRCGLSDRQAALILNAKALDEGNEMNPISKIRACVRRKRISSRVLKSKSLKNLPFTPLTVHWDGKTVKKHDDKSRLELLPIVVTSGLEEQFLHCALLDKGTGSEISASVFETLQTWDANVISMCYDTTSVNTGCHAGACKLLEVKLNKNLLNASCRHHVAELVLGSAFDHCFPEFSRSPEIQLLNNFRDGWSNINKKVYISALADRDKYSKFIIQKKTEVSSFIQQCLSLDKQPRKDYKELLQLSLIFLGQLGNICIKKPGANTRARWMARAIYVVKMYLFREQLSLTKEEKINLRKMSVFIVLIYVPYWFKTRLPLEAATSDIKLLRDLDEFKNYDKQLSAKVVTKFSHHLWYLSKELVCISFFNDNVDVIEKRKMKKNLTKFDEGDRELLANIEDVTLKNFKLSRFVTQKSMNFFHITGIPTDFLDLDPSEWAESESYSCGQEICKKLQCVNDVAERAVAMCDRVYKKNLTKNSEQLRNLFLTVYEDIKNNNCD